MQELVIGNTAIKYTIRRSEKAERKRIIVTPGNVEVVAPRHHPRLEVVKFVESKRKWVYTQVEKMGDVSPSLFPVNFVSGAKIPFRGRMMKLLVKFTAKSEPRVDYRNRFTIWLPNDFKGADKQRERNKLAKRVLLSWFKEKVAEDAERLITRYGKELGEFPKACRVKNQKHLWGSCGKDRIINLNWQLIFAPKSVLEYAVVHELCHLRYRNHSKAFWSLVGTLMPDYEFRKKWFELNEMKLRLE